MDTRTVSIDIQDFEDLRVNQDFYVDKTHFIKVARGFRSEDIRSYAFVFEGKRVRVKGA